MDQGEHQGSVIIQFNCYLCEIRKGDEVKEVYLPFWECVEGSEVSLGPDTGWKVLKVIHQLYAVR